MMAQRNRIVKRCCVLDCPSNIVNKNCKFYKFPTDFDSCQKWKFALKLIGTISDEHYVCEAHFGDDEFVGGNGKPKSKKQLKKDAQPTLNLPREHTYMKFGNPKRGRVTKAKVVKKTVKIAETSGCNGAIASTAPQLTKASSPNAPPRASPQSTYSRTSAPSNPWRMSRIPDVTICQDPLALGANKAQDPLALYPGVGGTSTRTVNANAPCEGPFMLVSANHIYKGENPKNGFSQHETWNHPSSSPQEASSGTLTLAQKILDEAINKVDVACKEIENATSINKQFTIPSEASEKITIQTQDDKVMELLLVKSNPKITNQVNEEFRVIDKLIDNTQAVFKSYNLNSVYPANHKSTQTDKHLLEDENRRLKMEILSLKWKVEKMEKDGNMKKKMFLCKEPGLSPFKKPAMSASRKPLETSPIRKPETSPFRKSEVSPIKKPKTTPSKKPEIPPLRIISSTKTVKTYSLPKIVSVSSLNAQTVETTPTSTSNTLNHTNVVDLTD